MTAMQIIFDGATYTLTDEAASCSYGEPVLVGPDSTQYRGGEHVLTMPGDPLTGNEITDFFAQPAQPMRAVDIAHAGECRPTEGFAFRCVFSDSFGEVEGLTDYGHATAEMFRRFSRQA